MNEIAGNKPVNLLSKDDSCVFIYSPFCGTCHLARKMLETVEVMWEPITFYELNAAFFPKLMQEYKIKSVPCLLLITNGEIKQTIYAFYSVPYLHNLLSSFNDERAH